MLIATLLIVTLLIATLLIATRVVKIEMRLALLSIVLLVLVSCSRPQGMWRDQYIFLGDDGTLLALVAQRRSPNVVELKMWMGQGARWNANFYHEGKASEDLRDVAKVLAGWSRQRGRPVRIVLSRNQEALQLRLRTREMMAELESEPLAELARFRDPEGLSVYSAGRATLGRGPSKAKRETGWLLVESTLPGQPRRLNVDYGDFAFVVVASPKQLLLVKNSVDRVGFDNALVHDAPVPGAALDAPVPDATTRSTRSVAVAVSGDRMTLSLPELSTELSLRVADRMSSQGSAPDGASMDYGVLLLQDTERVGVAFTMQRQL